MASIHRVGCVPPYKFALARGGRSAVSASIEEGPLCVFSVDQPYGQALYCADRSSWFRAVAFDPSTGHVVAGDESGYVNIWDHARPESTVYFRAHRDPVECVAASLNARTLVTGTRTGALSVFDGAGTHVANLAGHRGGVKTAVFFGAGVAASGSEDRTVRVWDVERAASTSILVRHTGAVHVLDFSADARCLVSAGDDSIQVWDTRAARAVHGIETRGILTAGLSICGHVIAASRTSVGVYTPDCRLVETINTGCALSSACWDQASATVVAFSVEGDLRRWAVTFE